MSVSVSMPQLGESVTEGTVTRWLKREGERVEADEPLLEVSTDKVDTEIPSPVSGVLRGITVAEDETVAVGAELADHRRGGIRGRGGTRRRQRRAPPARPRRQQAQRADGQPGRCGGRRPQGYDSSPLPGAVPGTGAAQPRRRGPEVPAAAAYQPPRRRHRPAAAAAEPRHQPAAPRRRRPRRPRRHSSRPRTSRRLPARRAARAAAARRLPSAAAGRGTGPPRHRLPTAPARG